MELLKKILEVVLEIILQTCKVFPSVQNKNSENSENPKITLSAKVIMSGIYKTYFEHKCITYCTYKFARKTLDITNKYNLSRILVTKIRVNLR